MIDIKQIKEQININHVISILSELGADYNHEDDEKICFRSICHGSDSYKLYYYKSSSSFYCFVDTQSWDIFGIVQHVKSITFTQSIQYICDICNINYMGKCDVVTNNVDDWQQMLKFIDKKTDNVNNNLPYDKSILSKCKTWYHEDFLNDGISKETMDKYGILFYPRLAQIVIPVYDEVGDFIGAQVRNTLPAKSKYDVLRDVKNNEYKFSTSNVLYGLRENMDAIKKSKSIILVEGAKAVMQLEQILDDNISVALFGMNCSIERRNMILSLGVDKVSIALDKDYLSIREDNGEFTLWRKKVNKIVKLFKPYCQVEIIMDDRDVLGYKDSPSDHGLDVWNKLRRIEV